MPIAVGRTSEGADGTRAASFATRAEPAGTLEPRSNPDPDVLVVEDDDDEVRFITRAIQRDGTAGRFKIVRSGEEALEYLDSASHGDAHSKRAPKPLPKVVLLDLKLSGIGGAEVLRHMRADAALRTIPVVILSSTSNEEEICNCYRIGANSFVSKPARSENPGAHVPQIARYWIDLNRPAGAP